MEKDELIEILKKARPDNIELPVKKFHLRRKLLNSQYYFKKSFWKRFLNFKFALRALAVLTVMIILLITDFTPREISAKDIIKNLENVYEKSAVPDKINYSQGTSIIYGENQQSIDFKFENWRDFKTGKVKFIRRDLKTGEVLDFKIFDGPRIWKPENSKMKIIRLEKIENGNNFNDICIGNPLTSIRLKEGSPSTEFNIQLDSNIKTQKFFTFIYKCEDRINENFDTCNSPKFFIYSRFIDVDEMNAETPRDILYRLKSQSNVVFLGADYDEKIGDKVLMLRRISTIPASQTIRVTISIDKNEKNESITKYSKDSATIDAANVASDNKANIQDKVVGEKREIIKISTSTGRIYQVNVSIFRDGKESKISEVTFYDDKYIDYDNSIFDHTKQGLFVVDEIQKR
jgi:hypothetical protein